MPQPTNCFICKNTWLGAGPICDDCNFRISGGSSTIYAAQNPNTSSPPIRCNFCGGHHDEADCLAASLAQHFAQNIGNPAHKRPRTRAAIAAQIAIHTQQKMAKGKRFTSNYSGTTTTRRSKPYVNYHDAFSSPPMKYCNACKRYERLETKAGSICTSCKVVTRNHCRNCNSESTHGLAGDNMQFIECNDCLFIE